MKYGTATITMPIAQLLSVPYALYAKNAESVNTENDPVYTNSEAANITETDITKLTNLSGTNTGDQDLASVLTLGNGASSQTISELADPVNSQDAATKAYVDALINGKIMKLLTETGVKDMDGNWYKVVKIGNQLWMAENLKTTKFNNGNPIPQLPFSSDWANATIPLFCWYNNSQGTYGDTYGALYNGYAVNTGKLCPVGWHVPTDAEWTSLENYLIANGYNYDGTTTGNKIAKSLASTTSWNTSTQAGAPGNNQASNNSSGFSGLPGGFRHFEGSFNSNQYNGFWWTSTTYFTFNFMRYLFQDSPEVTRDYIYRNSGYSIRCLKD